MRRKMVVSVIAALLVFLSTNTSVLAVEDSRGTMLPNYSYISAIGSDLSIGSNGYATCSGHIDIYVDYDSTITLTLQRSNNGRSWSDIKSWSKSFTTTGTNYLEKGYYVESGYYYRVLTAAEVKADPLSLKRLLAIHQ